MMFYIGLDVHTKQITVCVLNQDGKVHRRCQVREISQLMSFLKQIVEPFEICYEASFGYGTLFELLRPAGWLWSNRLSGATNPN